jgi:hypothetical protein
VTIIGGNARLNYDVFGRGDQVGVMPEARRRAIRRLRGMLAKTPDTRDALSAMTTAKRPKDGVMAA